MKDPNKGEWTMNKWTKFFGVTLAAVVFSALLFGTVGASDDSGYGTGDCDIALPAGDLSDAEAEGLLYMREEEKLARDVYLTLYDTWGVATFRNIAKSEQKHMDAILTLIDRYGLEDPTLGREAGEFADEELQALYDQLVAQGSESVEDALLAGAAIEEIDIIDLQDYVAQTDNADLQRVYQSLLRGSENHLRAFVSALEAQGGSYQPEFLSEEAYDGILSSSADGGYGRQQGGRGRGSRG
jgi:hypothetical protein